MKNRLNNEKGFTLIELVMVIVILGILAATAIPKFVDLSTNAETSVRDGVTGALQGAITMLHAQYLINDTAYTATLVANGVDTQGVTVSATSGTAIQATGIGSNTYTWTYTAGTGNNAATIAAN
ncbi:MAG: prepilin-type N-terminal cleavage/methylation domain-containing protein [Nitrospinae bacterium]|nr:prepilin-type N-terminal cleavage/methylation domain-containing protein [Nitrospinota bacterium]